MKEHDFGAAARALGASDRRLVILHILPNCLAPLLVQSSFSVAFGILTVVGHHALHGSRLSRAGPVARRLPGHRHLPRRARLNLLGDGIREALDPRLKN